MGIWGLNRERRKPPSSVGPSASRKTSSSRPTTKKKPSKTGVSKSKSTVSGRKPKATTSKKNTAKTTSKKTGAKKKSTSKTKAQQRRTRNWNTGTSLGRYPSSSSGARSPEEILPAKKRDLAYTSPWIEDKPQIIGAEEEIEELAVFDDTDLDGDDFEDEAVVVEYEYEDPSVVPPSKLEDDYPNIYGN